MTNTMRIDVLLATFRRPGLLAEALRSLAGLDLDGLNLRVVVVDNDKDATARTTVESFRRTVPFEIIYDIESVQGIAHARNRALSHVQSEYFAIIDDDETVPPDWLSIMYAAMQRYVADVVHGPLVGLLPPGTPAWAAQQPSFCRVRRATGTRLEFCATNNVLVRTSALGQPPQTFNLAYSLSGGEDAEFFYRLHRAGKCLIWCDEAVVTEHVPESRVTLKWLRHRGFRSGQSFMRIIVSRAPLPERLGWFAIKGMQLVAGIMAVPIVRLLSYSEYIKLTVQIMAAIGSLSIAFRTTIYEEYHADRCQ